MPRRRRPPGEVLPHGYVLPAPVGGALLRQGFDLIGRALRPTLGPAGRTVLVEQMIRTDPPELLDDAASVARRIVELPLRHNTGAMLMRHLVWRMLDHVGDGSATAAVIAQSLLGECARYRAAGAQPVGLRKGIETGLLQALEALNCQCLPGTGTVGLRAVAIAASHDEELADTLIDIHERYGPEIIVSLQESRSHGLDVEVADGSKWDSGFASPSFVNDAARNLAWAAEPRLLLTNVALDRAEQVIPIMQRVAAQGERELVVVAARVADAALSVMLTNNRLGALHTLAILAPGLGDHRTGVLQDLAAQTGGRYVNDAAGDRVEDVQPRDLGRCRVVWASRDFFAVIDGEGDPAAVAERARRVRVALEREEDQLERELLRLRLGRLTGGVAVLSVGAPTKTAMVERKWRAERAVRAVEAARSDGVVSGGGVALLIAAQAVETAGASLPLDERLGRLALARAMEEPFRVIVANAGGEPGPAAAAVRSAGGARAYDALTRTMVDVREAGILDPINVVRAALRDSVSVAVMAASTDTVVIPKDRLRQAPKNP